MVNMNLIKMTEDSFGPLFMNPDDIAGFYFITNDNKTIVMTRSGMSYAFIGDKTGKLSKMLTRLTDGKVESIE